MEIYLDRRSVRQLRLSAADAVEEGELDTLREDLMEAFSDDDIEEIERRIDSGDFYDFLSEILEEWSCEDVDELFELLDLFRHISPTRGNGLRAMVGRIRDIAAAEAA